MIDAVIDPVIPWIIGMIAFRVFVYPMIKKRTQIGGGIGGSLQIVRQIKDISLLKDEAVWTRVKGIAELEIKFAESKKKEDPLSMLMKANRE